MISNSSVALIVATKKLRQAKLQVPERQKLLPTALPQLDHSVHDWEMLRFYRGIGLGVSTEKKTK